MPQSRAQNQLQKDGYQSSNAKVTSRSSLLFQSRFCLDPTTRSKDCETHGGAKEQLRERGMRFGYSEPQHQFHSEPTQQPLRNDREQGEDSESSYPSAWLLNKQVDHQNDCKHPHGRGHHPVAMFPKQIADHVDAGRDTE